MHSNIASSKQIVSWIVENSLMVIVNRQISKRCAMVGNNTWYLSSHCSFVWVVLMNNFFPGRPSIVVLITIWDHALSSPVHQKICLKYGALMGLEPTTSILRVRRATHCTTPPLMFKSSAIFLKRHTWNKYLVTVDKSAFINVKISIYPTCLIWLEKGVQNFLRNSRQNTFTRIHNAIFKSHTLINIENAHSL